MSTGAQRKAPEPDIAAVAAPAAASARDKDRARRRRRAAMNDGDVYRGERYEFLDLDSPGAAVSSTPAASDRGVGTFGFAGTGPSGASGGAVAAAGLATLPGDGFGGGPSVPMMPGTWEPDPDD
jgi:PPE-repeat protein